MSLDLTTLVRFFAEFEHQVQLEAPPGLMSSFPRNTSVEKGLICQYSGYANCTFRIFQRDFTLGLAEKIDFKSAGNEGISEYVQPAELGSFILNFDERAEIYINDALKPGTDPKDPKKVLNDCYRRFLIMKEVFHVILRDEFARHKIAHPDTRNPELLVTLLEELIYLPFSLIDFDNPEYTDAIKVEHAAELFAALSLYPLDMVAADRAAFIEKLGVDSMDHPVARTSSTLSYAKKHMLPRRYVDLMFRWKRFDQLYALYKQVTKGYG